MKQCAICAQSIEHIKDPAILFIGRWGHQYELCPECEAASERFIEPKSENDRKEAADIIYHRFFTVNTDRKSAEMLDYMKSLFDESGKTLEEAREALRLSQEESENDIVPSAVAEENNTPILPEDTPSFSLHEEEDEISEEEFLADTAKKTPIAIKLVFLLLFLAVGGGAVCYGILRTSTFAIVAGAIVALLGIASVFTKD